MSNIIYLMLLLLSMMVDKQVLYKEKQVSNITYVTLACEDDSQLVAHKMRDK